MILVCTEGRVVPPPLPKASSSRGPMYKGRGEGLCDAEEHDDRSIEPRDVFVGESADALAETGPWDCGELVDHQLRWPVEPVELVCRHREANERRGGGIDGQRADRDRGGGVKAVVLNDDRGARLAGVGAAGGD